MVNAYTQNGVSDMSETSLPDLSNTFPLKDVVELVRIEISELAKEVDGKSLQFDVEKVELEFNAVVSKKTGMKAKYSILGLSAGAKADYKSEQVHKIKLSLNLQKAAAIIDPSFAKPVDSSAVKISAEDDFSIE